VLVVIVRVFGDPASVSTESINGFSSYESCLAARSALLQQQINKSNMIDVYSTAVCVKQ